jgi:O-antigen ligase
VQRIELIESRPRTDPRLVLGGLLLAALTVAAAFVLGGVLDIERQVLLLVIVDVLLLTTLVALYDITNAVILWLFALTCITRYTQLNLPGIPDMSGPRFMLVLMWAVFFIEVALRRRAPLPLHGIEIMMLVFVAVNLASMIQHENLLHTASRISPITAFMNFVVFPFSVYYLVRNSSAGDRATRKLLIAFAVLQIYLALTGIFEHYRVKWLVFPPDILDPKAGDGRWYGARTRGPYLHSPVYGATMGMGFFVLLHLYNNARGRWRWPLLIGLLASPLAGFYTLTRQVWLGFLLPLLVGAVISKRQRIALGLFLLAAAMFVVMINPALIADPEIVKSRAGDEATGEARLAHYVVGGHMFLDKPLFGHGLENWATSWESYRLRLGNIHSWFGEIRIGMARNIHAHNTFLRIAVELGIAGLIPYVAIFILIIRASRYLYRHSERNGLLGRDLVLTFWQSGLAFFICINFVDPSFDEFLPGYFLAFAAVIVRREEIRRAGLAAAAAAGTSFGEGNR